MVNLVTVYGCILQLGFSVQAQRGMLLSMITVRLLFHEAEKKKEFCTFASI